MRILFALPGLHRFDRGAEVALLSIATELAKRGSSITLIGSGPVRPSVPYRFLSGCPSYLPFGANTCSRSSHSSQVYGGSIGHWNMTSPLLVAIHLPTG